MVEPPVVPGRVCGRAFATLVASVGLLTTTQCGPARMPQSHQCNGLCEMSAEQIATLLEADPSRSEVTIDAKGSELTLRGDASHPIRGNGKTVVRVVNAMRVTISGVWLDKASLSIEVDAPSETVGPYRLEDLHSTGAGQGDHDVEAVEVVVRRGSLRGLYLLNAHVDDVGNDGNSHAIFVHTSFHPHVGGQACVSEDAQLSSIEDVVIAGAHVSNPRTGSSEAIAVLGNVKNVAILANSVEGASYIGIDVIGFEGSSAEYDAPNPSPRYTGGPSNVFVAGNRVTSAPMTKDSKSGMVGLYADGAKDVVFLGNEVEGFYYGASVELETELRCTTERAIIVGNTIMGSGRPTTACEPEGGALNLGGDDETDGGVRYAPDRVPRGTIEEVRVHDNTLGGAIYLQGHDTQPAGTELGTLLEVVRFGRNLTPRPSDSACETAPSSLPRDMPEPCGKFSMSRRELPVSQGADATSIETLWTDIQSCKEALKAHAEGLPDVPAEVLKSPGWNRRYVQRLAAP